MRDPAADLRRALPPVKPTHHAVIINLRAGGALLRATDGYKGTFVTKCALKLAPLLDETLHFRPDYIEQQLAHAVRDPNGRAYNRTAHLHQRQEMMQASARYLDELSSTL